MKRIISMMLTIVMIFGMLPVGEIIAYASTGTISRMVVNTDIYLIKDEQGKVTRRDRKIRIEIKGSGFGGSGLPKVTRVEILRGALRDEQLNTKPDFNQGVGSVEVFLDEQEDIQYDSNYKVNLYSEDKDKTESIIATKEVSIGKALNIEEIYPTKVSPGDTFKITGTGFTVTDTDSTKEKITVEVGSGGLYNSVEGNDKGIVIKDESIDNLKVPSSEGVNNVRVSREINQNKTVVVTLIGGIEVKPSGKITINRISPNNGSVEGGETVTITGVGLNGNTEIYFGTEKADNLGMDTNLEVEEGESAIKVKVPPSSNGAVYVDVIAKYINTSYIKSKGYRYEVGTKLPRIDELLDNRGYAGDKINIFAYNIQDTKVVNNKEVPDESVLEPVKNTDGEIKSIIIEKENVNYTLPNKVDAEKYIRSKEMTVSFGGHTASFEIADSDAQNGQKYVHIDPDKDNGRQYVKMKVPRIHGMESQEEIPVEIIIKTTYRKEGSPDILYDENYSTKTKKFIYLVPKSKPELEFISLDGSHEDTPTIDTNNYTNYKMSSSIPKSSIYLYGTDFRESAKVYFFEEGKGSLEEVMGNKKIQGTIKGRRLTASGIYVTEVEVPDIGHLGAVTVMVVNEDGGRTKTVLEYTNKLLEENTEKDLTPVQQKKIEMVQFNYKSSPKIVELNPKIGSTREVGEEALYPRVSIKGEMFLLDKDGDKVKPPEIYVVPNNMFSSDTTIEEIKNKISDLSDYKVKPEDIEISYLKDKVYKKIDGETEKTGTRITASFPSLTKADKGLKDIVLINSDGGFAIKEDIFVYKEPKSNPKIRTIDPKDGSIEGGEKVEIYGTNFEYAKDLKDIKVTVTIDGEIAKVEKFERLEDGNEHKITIITPPGTLGEKELQLINSDGGTAEGIYEYKIVSNNPIITKISPTFGSAGTTVLILGDDFVPKDGDKPGTKVFLGGYELKDEMVEVMSKGKIKITVPDGLTVGPKVVKVRNPDSSETTAKEQFNYMIPEPDEEFDKRFKIGEIVPDLGTHEGGSIITIKGDGFNKKAIVLFEGEQGKVISVNRDGTIIEVMTPPFPLNSAVEMERSVWVTVMNPDGRSRTKDKGFTFKIPESSPKIATIDPSKGSTFGGQRITIKGEDFRRFYKDENGNVKEGMPKVYFGAEEAQEVIYINQGHLIVISPPALKEGAVDVSVVNPDAGATKAKGGFKYELSKPTITKIVPDTIHRYGGTSITVKGTGFMKSEFKNKLTSKDIDVEVIFGNEKGEETIEQGFAELKVGNVTVVYDTTGPDGGPGIKVTSDVDLVGQSFTGKVDENNPLILELKTSKETEHLEGIKVSVKDDKLILTRRLATHVEWVDENTLYISTPPMDGIGTRDITIINRDNGTAKSKVEVKNPESEPKIINVYNDGDEGVDEIVKGVKSNVIYVNAKGGSLIEIKGSDFRKPVKVQIDEALEVEIKRDLGEEPVSTELSFSVPLGVIKDEHLDKEYRISVENEDGGSATSDKAEVPIYIKFFKGESNPQVTSVSPRSGPSKGGTKVTIKGSDFRTKMKGFSDPLKVYFDDGVKIIEVDSGNIKVKDIETIEVISPPHKAGKVEIKVKNPDGTMSQSKDEKNIFIYVSDPKITSVVDPNNGDIRKVILSIDGGETIKIVGNDFLRKSEEDKNNLRVVFNPKLEKIEPGADNKAEGVITILGIDYKLISGDTLELADKANGESQDKKEDLELVDVNTILVNKTPPGKVDSGGIIVINPDGSSTPIYDIQYGITEISHPRDVRASLIKNEYIRINWDAVTDKVTEADGKKVQYEVYVIEGNSRQFIGNTGTTGFIFRDIEPNKTYKFLVRSIGKYGSSKPIAESMSNEVRTGNVAGPVDNDGKLGEKTKIEKVGDTANLVIGEDAFKDASEYVIDLTRGTLAGSDKLVVSISAKMVVNGSGRRVKIVGRDYGLSFSPNVFENATVVTNKDNPNAGVKFEVTPTNTNFDLEQNNGDIILASKYFLRGRTYVGASSNEIENLKGKMNFILDYDANMATTRRLQKINLVKYDAYDRRFKNITASSGYGTSTGDINELGTYTITGSRR